MALTAPKIHFADRRETVEIYGCVAPHAFQFAHAWVPYHQAHPPNIAGIIVLGLLLVIGWRQSRHFTACLDVVTSDGGEAHARYGHQLRSP